MTEENDREGWPAEWPHPHTEATTTRVEPLEAEPLGARVEPLEAEALEAGPRTPVAPAQPAPVWDPSTASWVEKIAPRGRQLVERGTLRTLIAGAVAGAIVATLVAIPVARIAAPDAPAVERRLIGGLPATQGRTSSIVDIASRARPWVVNINVGSTEQSLFGDVQVQGTGSGIILRSDGHIVTNAHVVEGAGAVEVTLASGENLPAKIVGVDKETDVAVVKVNRSDLPAAVIGSVKDIQVGDTAVAIGSPLGLEQTVTAGIISALGRRVDRPNQTPLFDMIQTDAAITQGNSGGALVNGAGAVVGINSAIAASPEVGAEGVAFAIPIDVAVAVAEELVNSGRATHPWMGITGGNITPEAAKEFGAEQGAFIREVLPNGPAARAGLKANDVVVAFGGEKIDSMDDLVVSIRSHDVGETVQMAVVRNGKRLTLSAVLGDKPNNL
jgi:S1-C subfamily serine protease